MQFTEKFVQALRPKAVRYEVREGNGDGFAIRINPSSEKSWIFFYVFEGRKRRMTLGSYPALSLKDARQMHRDALSSLEKGNDPGAEKKKKMIDARLSVTVEDLIEEYIEKWAKPRKRSWKGDLRILEKDVKPHWGKRKAKDISRREIILLLDSIKARGAPIGANRTLACIRRMFNFAVERDIVETSPCVAIKALSKENRRDRVLSVDEIRTIWRGLSSAPMTGLTKLVIKLQLATAQRKGEVISAEWSEIDANTRWWTIPANKAKNSQTHRVWLSALALELIEEAKEFSVDSSWLFPSDKTKSHLTGAAVDHALRRCNFEGVGHWTPHDCRRSAASYMTSMGISRLIVSKILNHVENSVTAIYDRHSYDAEKKSALEAWGNRLREIINGIDITDNVIELKKLSKAMG